jgi:hypothetical protein
MKYLLIILSLFFIISCTTQKKCQEKFPCITTNTTRIDTIKKDTTIFIETDQAWLKALILCDSNNNAYIDSIQYLNGRKIGIRYIFKDKILTVNADIDSQAVSLKWNELHVKDTTNHTQILPPTDTKFIRTLKWLFWILLLMAGTYIFSVVYRSFKK